MNGGLVSAVIPTHNYGHFVVEAVDSALAQTYPAMEVIVVDDGSTDDTRQRLDPYKNRIRYIYQENRGLSAARNTGIRKAQGEWIALLDSDDVWHQQKTEVQLRAARAVAACGLIGAMHAGALEGVLPDAPAVERLAVRDFLVSAPFGPSSALIRKDVLEKVGLFDETLRSVEDRDMWLRLAVHVPCVQVDSPCWWYRSHGDQMNRNAQRMFENYSRVLTKFFTENPQCASLRPLAYSYLYFDAAWSFFAEGDRWTAIKYLAKSAYWHPGALDGAARRLRWARCKEFVRYSLGNRLFCWLRAQAR